MSISIPQIQAAVEQGRLIAEGVMNCEAKFYDRHSASKNTPVFTTKCRVKKPKPSAFDAGNPTEWGTKRVLVLQIPRTATSGVIKQGLIVQVSGSNDDAINGVTFVVQNQLESGYAYARNVVVETDVKATPRVGG